MNKVIFQLVLQLTAFTFGRKQTNTTVTVLGVLFSSEDILFFSDTTSRMARDVACTVPDTGTEASKCLWEWLWCWRRFRKQNAILSIDSLSQMTQRTAERGLWPVEFQIHRQTSQSFQRHTEQRQEYLSVLRPSWKQYLTVASSLCWADGGFWLPVENNE